MARITLENLEVTSFFTETAPAEETARPCTREYTTCPDTKDPDLCVCTADISTCPRTTDPIYCICTADISTCSRTSPQGGCDTSVQCVAG